MEEVGRPWGRNRKTEWQLENLRALAGSAGEGLHTVRLTGTENLLCCIVKEGFLPCVSSYTP
jgi:hypothetical protein